MVLRRTQRLVYRVNMAKLGTEWRTLLSSVKLDGSWIHPAEQAIAKRELCNRVFVNLHGHPY